MSEEEHWRPGVGTLVTEDELEGCISALTAGVADKFLIATAFNLLFRLRRERADLTRRLAEARAAFARECLAQHERFGSLEFECWIREQAQAGREGGV